MQTPNHLQILPINPIPLENLLIELKRLPKILQHLLGTLIRLQSRQITTLRVQQLLAKLGRLLGRVDLAEEAVFCVWCRCGGGSCDFFGISACADGVELLAGFDRVLGVLLLRG